MELEARSRQYENVTMRANFEDFLNSQTFEFGQLVIWMCHKLGLKFSESSFLNSGLCRRYVVLLVAKTKAAKVFYLLIIESILFL